MLERVVVKEQFSVNKNTKIGRYSNDRCNADIAAGY